jgi:uncharacterized protein (TIGR03083 family)
MLTVDAARHAAIRDLDATLARLRGLNTSDWSRLTPCEDWLVKDLAAHLAEQAFRQSVQAAAAVEARMGTALQLEDDMPANPYVPNERILERLTHGRNQLHHVLHLLAAEDATFQLAPDPPDGPAWTVERLLAVCVAEYGIHRFDLEAAMGEHEAGVSQETILAAAQIYGPWLDSFARKHDHVPDRPLGLHLEGELIDATLSWNGKVWQSGRAPTVPVTHIRGDDSTITLFLYGRIPADDHRLDVEGDLTVAKSFKNWVPGP